MACTVCLICLNDNFIDGISSLFLQLFTRGINGPQGQIVRIDKKSKIRIWSCGKNNVYSINCSQATEVTNWSYNHINESFLVSKLKQVLEDADIVNAIQIIIIADLNGQKGWEKNISLMEHINIMPCMIHVIQFIEGSYTNENDFLILKNLNKCAYASDIWLNSPQYSCLVAWTKINGYWKSIYQGISPLKQFIR